MDPFSHLPELAILCVIALIVFGPSRLPEVGNSVGKAMREFRRATSEIEEAVMHHADSDDGDEEGGFPHVPPSPDVQPVEPVAPTIDTLAQRREARQRVREEAAQLEAADRIEPTTEHLEKPS